MGDHLVIEQIAMHRTTQQIFIIVRWYDRTTRFSPPARLIVEYNHWLVWER
jgi:hypothetical protein